MRSGSGLKAQTRLRIATSLRSPPPHLTPVRRAFDPTADRPRSPATEGRIVPFPWSDMLTAIDINFRTVDIGRGVRAQEMYGFGDFARLAQAGPAAQAGPPVLPCRARGSRCRSRRARWRWCECRAAPVHARVRASAWRAPPWRPHRRRPANGCTREPAIEATLTIDALPASSSLTNARTSNAVEMKLTLRTCIHVAASVSQHAQPRAALSFWRDARIVDEGVQPPVAADAPEPSSASFSMLAGSARSACTCDQRAAGQRHSSENGWRDTVRIFQPRS